MSGQIAIVGGFVVGMGLREGYFRRDRLGACRYCRGCGTQISRSGAPQVRKHLGPRRWYPPLLQKSLPRPSGPSNHFSNGEPHGSNRFSNGICGILSIFYLFQSTNILQPSGLFLWVSNFISQNLTSLYVLLQHFKLSRLLAAFRKPFVELKPLSSCLSNNILKPSSSLFLFAIPKFEALTTT